MEGPKKGGHEVKLSRRGMLYRERLRGQDRGEIDRELAGNPEKNAFFEKILSAIDKEELIDVFTTYLRKSGVPEERTNTEAIRNIVVVSLQGREIAQYHALLNRIAFASDGRAFVGARELWQKTGEIPEELLLTLRLFLFHEIAHSFSRTRVTISDARDGAIRSRTESGYSTLDMARREARYIGKRFLKGKSLYAESFVALNEGVTQRIAEEVFYEYHKRTGESEQAAAYLSKFNTRRAEAFRKDDDENKWRYTIYQNQVDHICDRIAAYIGLPKESVWNSFKRGYFEERQLYNEETTALLAETFGETFLDDYRKLSNESYASDVASFDGTYGVEHPGKYAEKWLEHLGIKK